MKVSKLPKSDEQAPELGSRTQLKREMEALQKIGKELIALPANEFSSIDLPEELRKAILLAHTLKSNEAKRRHLQYIGKLMRTVEVEPIQAAIVKIKYRHSDFSTQFHKVEKWRDRFIAEGDDALQEFIDAHPNADRQQLRQLIRNAQKDQSTQKNTGGAKTLFRAIQKVIQEV